MVGIPTANNDTNSVNVFRFNTTTTGPTFFMADRMRRQGGKENQPFANRPISIDEANTTQNDLASTNIDPKALELLPNVS